MNQKINKISTSSGIISISREIRKLVIASIRILCLITYVPV